MKIKIISLIISALLIISVFAGCKGTKPVLSSVNENTSSFASSQNISSELTSSEAPVSSEIVSSQAPVSSSVPVVAAPSSAPQETVQNTITNTLFPGYKYNTQLDMEDNVFIDALAYTGYNVEKHRADGLMWYYILSKDKRHRGWLSNITFGGGSSGLETTAEGLPDIKAFERGGLVCASFASYVYFNYLPNVAKIDTSSLDVPDRTYSAPSFQAACKKWLAKGYTYNIGFTAKNTAGAIVFNPEQEIPMGSIIIFRNIEEPGKTVADHITIYIGKRNGYHWVIQTGNKNGPEFCAVERFKFGPDPQWPLEIYATPTCIYDAISAPAQ